MNILELKRLIKELKRNPIENKELIEFYKIKESELIREINEKIREKLKAQSPFIELY